jgi:hypothetical protein
MASRLGGDVWHGNAFTWIDRHHRSCSFDDKHASLLNLGPAHWSIGLGPPRRFDSARPRSNDDLFMEENMRSRFISVVRFVIGFGALFGLYLLFNLSIGGTPMPNTFYAKQAEYASWQLLPITERLGQMFLQLLVGPSLVLIPGIIGWLVKSIKERLWGSLAAIIWCVGYLGLYISRLPVYQHGRYIMPAMPIFFLVWSTGFRGI